MPLATTVTQSTELTNRERIELQRHEQIINECVDDIENARQRAAIAFAEIREKRLYREKADTFELYCKQQFGHGREYGNRKAAAGKVLISLIAGGFEQLPNERQARPLVSLSPQERREAWEQTLKVSDGEPTHAIVSEVKERIKANPVQGATVELHSPLNPVQQAHEGEQGVVTERKSNGTLFVSFDDSERIPLRAGQVKLVQQGEKPPKQKHRPHKVLLQEVLDCYENGEDWGDSLYAEVLAACG